MTIQKSRNNGEITVLVEGRVDTNTSPQLQSEILGAFQEAKRVVLDFEKVSYISSAGLRAILIGQKTAASKNAAMELAHVPDMVMAVLQSVGFTQILTIRG